MTEPWIARVFRFDCPVERAPVLVSRLRGTAPRLATALRAVAPEGLTHRPEGAWSIHDHVGHLADLDDLHLRRLDELANGVAVLTAADMQNRRTWAAGHNERPLAELMAAFERRRGELVQRLAALDDEGLAHAARHPRLQQPMRAIDVAFFAAEHDDHHVARVEELALVARRAQPAVRATAAVWAGLPVDAPMRGLERRRVIGREAMISHVTLRAGCVVPVHEHDNEQFTCVLSGRVLFTLDGGQRELGPGEVLHLPGRAPHGAEALEDSVVLDVFAPPSADTGIDRSPASGARTGA